MIGEKLSKAREEKGITISTAEEATKIRAKFLEAMENDRFNALPGRVYAKAFLRTYARYLELDEAVLAAELDRFFEAEQGHSSGSKPHKEEKPRPPFNWQRYRSIFLIVAVVGLLLAFNGIYEAVYSGPAENAPALPHEDTTQTPAKPPVNENKTPPSTGEQSYSPVPEPEGDAGGQDREDPAEESTQDQQGHEGENNQTGQSGDTTPEEQTGQTGGSTPAGQTGQTGGTPGTGQAGQEEQKSQGVTLSLNATRDKCWTQVNVDGVPAFEGMLWAGDARSFSAQNSITVILGNAGAVEVISNEQNHGYLGGIGQIVTREFTP
ncbi:MAG: RodZ domain-containing protein [Bacillota bacterium]